MRNRRLTAVLILSFFFLISFGCKERSATEKAETAPAPAPKVAAPPRAPAPSDDELAAFGREYAAKFNENPAQTYADLIDVAKIVESVAQNELVPIDSETLAEIERDLLASGNAELAKQSAPLFANADFYFVGVRRLDAQTFVVLRGENWATGVNYFMIECAPNADGRLVPGDVFVPLKGVAVAEAIASGIVEFLGRIPRGFERLNPRKVGEYAKLREYIQKSDAATQKQDFAKIVELYEKYDVANRAFTSRDSAYVDALGQLYSNASHPDEAAELERKIRETSRRIAARTPGYLGGEIALLDVYAARGDEAKFDAVVEKIRAVVGNDPYWTFYKIVSFPENAPEKTLESLQNARENGLESRFFYLYYLEFLLKNFPKNFDNIAEIERLYNKRFGASPFENQ